jgi:WD40 repeat protein
MRKLLTLLALSLFFIGNAAGPSVQAADPKTRTLTGPRGNVVGIALSPDGKRVAAASDISEKEMKDGKQIINIKSEGEVRVWDAATGDLKRTFTHSMQFGAVAFSPDGKRLAAGAFREAKIWDVNTWKLVHTLKDPIGGVNGLAFSRDGKLLASSSSWFGKGEVRLWETRAWKPIRTLQSDQELTSLAMSGDGKTIAAGCRLTKGGFRGEVKIWDGETGALKHTLPEPKGWVDAVALCEDGRTLASSAQFTVTVWDVRTGKPKRSVQGFLRGPALTADGATLAVLMNFNDLKLLDLNTGVEKRTLRSAGHVWSYTLSADGTKLAVGSGDAGKGEVTLWDLRG